MTHVKIVNWRATHRDTYVYKASQECWLKLSCRIDPGMACTAPHRYNRGKCPGYSAMQEVSDFDLEEAILSEGED